ncbi:hypothetical protein [Siminovitchia sp. 179-K 8D1 HS]|uniref:hypothetical protein n=1 Tax=Siminovitchia sp. 179-K 8D1 HS TaxID=3142385 RepID=UPI0039A09E33
MFLVLLISRLILLFATANGIEEYGDLPSEIAMLVQMVSIFYIVFFYRIQAKEFLFGVQSFFVDGYRIMMEKISAMFAAHFLFQGFLLAITYSLYLVVYMAVGIEPSGFYLSLLRFLIVYMFAPFMLNMLFGVIMAMIFGIKKSSFFGILFIWIATGSMNKELFFDFFATVHANEWKSLLFIGMNTPMTVYHSFTGFDVHWGNELKLMTWFLIAAGIIFMLSLRWTHNTRERHHVIKVLLGIFFLSVISSFSAVELSTKAFSNADHATETKYYEKLHKVEADLRYEIESYRISLEGKQATAKITLSRLDTMKPTFQLYHAYPIKSVTAGNERVGFERNGDIVKVHLPENTSLLTFHYEIVDTSYVPYTNGRTVLLADKAWYPKKERHICMR